MKIIILGAGQVGTTVAYNLSNEANDITVVDQDNGLLRELQDRLDIHAVQGARRIPTCCSAPVPTTPTWSSR